MQQLTPLRGAIHVHSRYSDGSDGMETIVAAAKDAGLDYVVVTDHNALKAKSLGWEGWHNGVLVIVGCEISGKSSHCVALNVTDCRKMYKLPPPEYLRKIKSQGGTALVAHPKGTVKREFGFHIAGWDCWDNPDYAGMEIWSYMHDWIAGCHITNLREYIKHPDEHIAGPSQALLELWDKLAEKRRIVGVGALDNHGANFPIRKLPWKLFKVFPHEFCFRTVRTHVLTRPLTRKDSDDVDAFLEALVKGRCYVDYAPLGDGTGFRFTAVSDGKEYQMGDQVPGGRHLEFRISSPCPAEITLLRNGLAEAAAHGTQLEHSIDGRPGVYRVEARLKGRPWLFTNHIYVRSEETGSGPESFSPEA